MAAWEEKAAELQRRLNEAKDRMPALEAEFKAAEREYLLAQASGDEERNLAAGIRRLGAAHDLEQTRQLIGVTEHLLGKPALPGPLQRVRPLFVDRGSDRKRE
jgi:hypothetical protein